MVEGAEQISFNLTLSDGNRNYMIPNVVEYRRNLTPVVEFVEPLTASTRGGTVLTIRGTGFGNSISDINVVIDGVNCTVR